MPLPSPVIQSWALPAALSMVLACATPRPALAQQPHVEMPEHDFGLGPSAAYLHGDGHGFMLTLEGSYTYDFFTAALDFKFAGDGGGSLYGPQLELSIWHYVNIGAGAGYLFGSRQGPVAHLFFGLPLPGLHLPEGTAPFSTLYFEPYYRLHFFFPGGGVRLLHESGVMVKINTYAL